MTTITAMPNARLTRHHGAVLAHIPVDRPFALAELGVAAGEMSEAMLAARPLLALYMVDAWAVHGTDSPYHRWCQRFGDPNGVRSAEEVAADERAAAAVCLRHAGRCRLVRRDTAEAAWECTAQFDGVFVDADHSESGCGRDIHAWWPLVRPGGWIGGHDFRRPKFDGGVERAVRRFLATDHRLQLVEGDGWTWFVDKPIGGAE